jgi:hypothetical protein
MATINDLIEGNIAAIKDAVLAVDLSDISTKINNISYRNYFNEKAGREHYQLISWVASQFPGQTVMDIGTHYGNSSLAMANDKTAKVVSYDIIEMKQLLNLPENVEYKIGDFREDPLTMTSPFIFIDVDPHDGIQERDFHEWFIKSGYKGITLWDDIHCNPEMNIWWSNVSGDGVKKYDFTEIGHWSGTGVIVYG